MAIGFWNDINSARATKMWAEGQSASQIGAQLGCSRNAVIGRIHRMGLASRAANHQSQTTRTVRARRRKHTLQSVNNRRRQSGAELYASYEAYEADRASKMAEYEALKQLPDVEVPPHERRGLLDLEPGDCRWGINDPRSPDFHFCNRLQVGAETRMERGRLPYCSLHAARAYAPPDPVRRDFRDATAFRDQREKVDA